jgi:hypothetical protein
MIKANELRIGNWVKSDDKIGDIWQIERIENGDTFVVGIPLAPEILEKCGFIKKKILDTCFVYDIQDSYFCYTLNKKGDTFEIVSGGYDSYNIDITESCKYLHQLQNLYWCLCGEELVVNLQ